MQIDFCGEGGFAHQAGSDFALLQATIAPTRRVLRAFRAAGHFILHTREGHRPDLSDLNDNKRWRSARAGAEIGSPGPCGRMLTRGEPGWQIVPELVPLPTEPVIDKPGKGAFHATDLDHLLRRRGIRNLVFAGVTSDCCVHTTMSEACDRGYDCLLLEDCTASVLTAHHATILNLTLRDHGLFGAVTTSTAVLEALPAPTNAPSGAPDPL
ncbi:isochorismatase family protein [Pseudooceanicola sp. GBMRC 2024]|uniref:Isochorismatase family protein n=2 Tax=Paracoccaceae TaxID=31989 RepID=A0A6L7G8I6_9RHOB|nr:isochorismatase family protein [Pseudooceanicola albus]